MKKQKSIVNDNMKQFDSIDLAKFIFAFSVIYIHAGGGTVTWLIPLSIINAFNSLAVPFFFIASGYFFFTRIEKLEGVDKKKYAKKYIAKTIKIYTIWSVVLLPTRISLSKDKIFVALIKWARTFFFIGDAQLWYLNALIIGLLLIMILKKYSLSDKYILLISIILYIIGLGIQKNLDVMEIYGYSGILKYYYIIFGKTVKNGFLTGMIYCMIGKVILNIKQYNKSQGKLITIGLFIIYVIGVYNQYNYHALLLPILSFFVFCTIKNFTINLGKWSKWFRSMSTLLFLSHYIFVRMIECMPFLGIHITEGICKLIFVTISAFSVSLILLMLGNRNESIRTLWQ